MKTVTKVEIKRLNKETTTNNNKRIRKASLSMNK